MIKRPGNESYLRKMVEEERKAYCEVLELASDGVHVATQSSDSETDSEQ